MLMVHRALAAAERLAASGIDGEVIDVRYLVPLDMTTIEASVRKTERLLIVEEDHLTGGWGTEVAARSADAAFSSLARRSDA
jgi:pyruvate/2-oxoglutarate/acetoin dehydrogenase E1 component